METRRWLPGFVALSAIWGASFALIKVAVGAGVPPAWVACWRCLLGAVALLAVLAVTRQRLPRAPRAWAHAAVAALLLNTVPFILLAYGETRVSSVEAGVLNAATPLFTVVFAMAMIPGERPGRRRVAGLALGLVGVVVVLGAWRAGPVGPSAAMLVGGLACLGATACYGAGFAYTRRYLTGLPYSAATLATLQVTCATAELVLVAPLLGGAPRWPGGTGVVGALVVLGVLGTGAAYLLNTFLVRSAGATVASTVTYAIPVWATGLGAVLLSEPVGWSTVAGGLLVVVAIALTRRSGTRPSSPCPRAPGCGSAAGTGRGSR
jgi:drug/metabolite transporter (DMT)-like permease